MAKKKKTLKKNIPTPKITNKKQGGVEVGMIHLLDVLGKDVNDNGTDVLVPRVPDLGGSKRARVHHRGAISLHGAAPAARSVAGSGARSMARTVAATPRDAVFRKLGLALSHPRLGLGLLGLAQLKRGEGLAVLSEVEVRLAALQLPARVPALQSTRRVPVRSLSQYDSSIQSRVRAIEMGKMGRWGE